MRALFNKEAWSLRLALMSVFITLLYILCKSYHLQLHFLIQSDTFKSFRSPTSSGTHYFSKDFSNAPFLHLLFLTISLKHSQQWSSCKMSYSFFLTVRLHQQGRPTSSPHPLNWGLTEPSHCNILFSPLWHSCGKMLFSCGFNPLTKVVKHSLIR